MNRKTVSVPADPLRAFMRESLVAAGASPEEAGVVSDVLIAADLRGLDTHGISRLRYYHDRIRHGVTRPGAPLEVIRETPTTAVLDGQHGFGHVIGVRAMRMAVQKAGGHGLGAVAVRHSTHYGIAGYYAEMAAAADCIGLTASNARPCAAPTFGVEPLFGTNPLAFAAPSDDGHPFVFDAALTAIQRGKLEVWAREGRPVPDGLVIDEQGHGLTDPADILKRFLTGAAAFLPLGGAGDDRGGHKGYGMSILVEILSAALAGGAFLSALAGGDREGTWKPYGTGHFFLAIRVDAFIAVEEFRRAVGQMQRELRASGKAPGHDRIWTAGEKEWECEQQRRRDGIPVSPALQEELLELRRALKLDPALLPFE
jgi:L-2-hydroxycarboxylate dehydrogenase (NAD+)